MFDASLDEECEKLNPLSSEWTSPSVALSSGNCNGGMDGVVQMRHPRYSLW